MKNERGITIFALTLTITVMLILAGAMIYMLASDTYFGVPQPTYTITPTITPTVTPTSLETPIADA